MTLALGLALLFVPALGAQEISPTPSLDRGPMPADLTCTAEVENHGSPAATDGSVLVFEVPAADGVLRLRLTCENAFGATVGGQSPLVVPVPGGVTEVGLDFLTAVPIATRLDLAPGQIELTGLAAAVQLTVTAIFPATPAADVTAAAGTVYATSNPAVATVEAGGLVVAQGPGTAIVGALHEGALGVATVVVLPASLVSLEAAPSPLELVRSPLFPAPAAELRVTGALADGSTADLTAAAAGTAYASSDPAVAAVDAGGRVTGLAAGSATVTASHGAFSAQVAVEVSELVPGEVLAFDTPGFSHEVDIAGSLAFVADGPGGLAVFDTAGAPPLPGLAFGGLEVLDVKIRGALVAVVLSSGEIALVDASDPGRLWQMLRLGAGGGARDLWLSGERLYAVVGSELSIWDLGVLPQPGGAPPVLAGSQDLGAPALAVAADTARGVAVVVTAEPALVVLETSGPPPWPQASVPLPAAADGPPADVALWGPWAYVANGRAGVHRVDISDPAAPVRDADTVLDFGARGVAVRATPRGTLVAAADDFLGGAVPLFAPELAEIFTLGLSASNGTGIALGPSFGAVSLGADGLRIFRFDRPVDPGTTAPAVAITTPLAGAGVPAEALTLVAATASDDVGLALVELFADGQLVAADPSPPFTGTFTTSSQVGVTHLLGARATDLAGNTADALPVTVTVEAPGLPPQEDADLDGLPNGTELLLGTDPLNPDSDGDGWWEGVEVETGANPLDPNSRPPVTVVSQPRVSALVPQVVTGDPPGGLSSIVAQPPVSVLVPQVVTGDPPGGLNSIIAQPPVSVLVPQVVTGDPPGGLNSIIAQPPVSVLVPQTVTGAPPGGLNSIVAEPPVTVTIQGQ